MVTDHRGGELEVRGLSVRYQRVIAVDAVDLRIPPGAIVGLVGPNGAGKTSLIEAVTGFVRCSGDVLFNGAPLAQRAPHERARLGLTRTFQSAEAFDDLTVAENIKVANQSETWASMMRDLLPRRRRAAVESPGLQLLGLERFSGSLPKDLPLGLRKLVGVARALSATTTCLLLDEPAAGLDTSESLRLGDKLREIRDLGVSQLLVDHDMGLVLSVCDTVYVLDGGRLISAGPPSMVRSDPEVVRAYLGTGAAGRDT